MSVGFGFSAGDFIAALKLVSTITSALRDSGGSSAEYKALVSQLDTLKGVLERVQALEIDDALHAEATALRQAAAQSQRTIDAFWEKIRKYQPSLGEEVSGSVVKDGWRKVKWAVCKKEDIAGFKADLMGHTESIELLLMIVQMAETRRDSKICEQNAKTMAGRVQDSYFGCMRRINVVVESVTTSIQQGKQLLGMVSKIMQTNIRIFQIVLNIEDIISRVPGQIDMQPVYFVDAIGRRTPFHLEFITCPQSLTAVLKNNFRTIGPGATKIELGEFVLQDSVTKVDIDLGSPWETCFHPGQQISMSMLFDTLQRTRLCPKCKEPPRPNHQDEDIECTRCKMVFRQYTTETQPESIKSSAREGPDTARSVQSKIAIPDANSDGDLDLQMSLFRRIRIRNHWIQGPQPEFFVRALYDYEADDNTTLSFHEGDIIHCITKLESGWWNGVVNGVRGWFPSNYCQVIDGNTDIAQTVGSLQNGGYVEDSNSDAESSDSDTESFDTGTESFTGSIEDSEFFDILSKAIDEDSGYGDSRN